MKDNYTVTESQAIFYQEKNKVLRSIQSEIHNTKVSLNDDLLATDERDYLRRKLASLTAGFQTIATLNPYNDNQTFNERLAKLMSDKL